MKSNRLKMMAATMAVGILGAGITGSAGLRAAAAIEGERSTVMDALGPIQTRFLTGGTCPMDWGESKSYGYVDLVAYEYLDLEICNYATMAYSSTVDNRARRLVVEWINNNGVVVDTDYTPWVCDSVAFLQQRRPGDDNIYYSLSRVRFWVQSTPCG